MYTYSMHGGAGALISIGLLRSVSFEAARKHVKRSWNSGGDAFITTALWEVGNLASLLSKEKQTILVDPNSDWDHEIFYTARCKCDRGACRCA